MASRFRLWRTRYDAANDRWSDAECELETENSYLAQLDGSGKKLIEKQGLEWVGTNVDGTSRAAIWSFCDALKSGEDPHSGGPPQLVGIWRKGPAQNFGFIWDGKRYFGGLEITAGSASNSVNWFNHLFERCDGISGKRLKGAQPHVKPISF
ncbi:MAG: hypothetical protein GY948_24420 [Alphaproteobacteria bacterium]|nr:hypothetical protein [Alphaproteobacteria bacterium]